MTVNSMKPFLGVLGAALVALVFAAPNAFAAPSQPAATSISSDTVQVVKGDVALIGDDQPTTPPSDQTKPKSKGKKGKGKGKGKAKPKTTTPPTTETAPKTGN
ncbi:MAG: hypothetical protein WAN51_04475 [Alphaproteobacteria bacterium]